MARIEFDAEIRKAETLQRRLAAFMDTLRARRAGDPSWAS